MYEIIGTIAKYDYLLYTLVMVGKYVIIYDTGSGNTPETSPGKLNNDFTNTQCGLVILS